MEFVDLKTQYRARKSHIDARIASVLAHGRFIMGPEVSELEQRLADYVGVNHCISVASGSDALLVALMALGIKAGDEVITTPFSFVASSSMIALLGARPVFVDIDERTYNLQPALIEAAVTPRTRAIVAVSLFGQCADFDAINAVAGRHGIAVIEDAAQSFGATYKGRRSGALSTLACTSFFPSKPLGCYGDGGACFTDDDALAQAIGVIRAHGEARRYQHTTLGINSRLDTLQAAVLLAKMDFFDDELAARARIAARYGELVSCTGIDVSLPFVADYGTSTFAQYTLQAARRDEMVASMTEAGVPAAVHYPLALHLQPVFRELDRGYGRGSFPLAEHAATRVFSLPMHAFLEPKEQDRVVSALATALDAVDEHA